MFEISVLKEMKLAELQEIAKAAKTIKISGVKKEVLISQILEHQATTTNKTVSETPTEQNEEVAKPKKTRIQPVKKGANANFNDKENEVFAENPVENNEIVLIEQKVEEQPNLEFENKESEANSNSTEKRPAKIVKFSKSAYESKIAQT